MASIVRYCGNARLRVLWCADARASEDETPGAYHVSIRDSERAHVGRLYTNPGPIVFSCFIVDGVPSSGTDYDQIACEAMTLALADEDARGALSPDLDDEGNPRIHR